MLSLRTEWVQVFRYWYFLRHPSLLRLPATYLPGRGSTLWASTRAYYLVGSLGLHLVLGLS